MQSWPDMILYLHRVTTCCNVYLRPKFFIDSIGGPWVCCSVTNLLFRRLPSDFRINAPTRTTRSITCSALRASHSRSGALTYSLAQSFSSPWETGFYGSNASDSYNFNPLRRKGSACLSYDVLAYAFFIHTFFIRTTIFGSAWFVLKFSAIFRLKIY